MAKKKPNAGQRPVTPQVRRPSIPDPSFSADVEQIKRTFSRCTEWFKDERSLFKDTAVSKDKLTRAFGWWAGYPLLKEMVIDSRSPQTLTPVLESQLHGLRYLLNQTHTAATEVLMRAAEAVGIDSSTIWKSGVYCRDLLTSDSKKYYQVFGTDCTWPDCLGESLYELPVDIRTAIQDGHAQVLRLDIKADDETMERLQKAVGQPNGDDGARVPITVNQVHSILNDAKTASTAGVGAIQKWASKWGTPIAIAQGKSPASYDYAIVGPWLVKNRKINAKELPETPPNHVPKRTKRQREE